LRSLAPLPK